ncbi:MAG: hypothetical protein RIQ55_516 [Pseudomonadota bacterium]|jgi:hypothetical protein
MRLKHPLLIGAIALVLLNMTGCASSGSTESLDNIQQQLLGDMPLPQGSKISNEQSLILGGGPQWTGRIVIISPQGPTDTFAFFREQFPKAGWTGISSIKAKTSILVFAKGDRTVTVEINEAGTFQGGGSMVSLTAAPKGGTAPVNLNSQPASR